MKNPLDLSPFGFWTLVLVITPPLAGLVTWATGYLQVPSFSGGFPFAWREMFFLQCAVRSPLPSCRGPSLIACYCPVITQVSYDWPSFAIDLVFNTAVGYLAILVLPTAIRLVRSSRLMTRVGGR